jgi:hypothetical protein
MARKTHSLGRDHEGLLVDLVEAGQVFLLRRQGRAGASAVSIQLSRQQIAEMASAAGVAVPK